MLHANTPLQIVRFKAVDYNLDELAKRLTTFKSLTTRTPTSVTVDQLRAIDESPTNVLLLQVGKDDDEQLVVGMVHLAIIYLEDRVHLGPICIDANSVPRGHGTPLMQAAIEYVKTNFVGLRRIDLSNRPSHDYTEWYKKFGFTPRTEETGDPTTVFRLSLS